MSELIFYIKSFAACGPSIGCHLNAINSINRVEWNMEVCADGWSPDMSFVPPRKFRRLSRLSKMALYAAHHASIGDEQASIGSPVFCTRYGELQHTVQIIDAIRSEELISPMDFSYSVYNTGQGLFSILNQDERPATVISARECVIEEALIKAAAQLFMEDSSVLIVYQEDKIPEVYGKIMKLEVIPMSFAFVVSKDCKDAYQKIILSSEPAIKDENWINNICTEANNSHEMDILKLLSRGKGDVVTMAKRLNWMWRCETL